jgi:uncharacterized membrane protein YesL
MKLNWWIIATILTVVLGSAFIITNYVVYVPKLNAFSQAGQKWVKNPTSTSPPSPESFGLTLTSILVSSILGWIGSALIFIGILCLAILLIRWVGKKTDRKTA